MNESYVIVKIFFAKCFIPNEQNGDTCITSNRWVIIDANRIIGIADTFDKDEEET